MQGNHRFVEKAYTLKLLIAAAYDLNTRTISGGPGGSNPTTGMAPDETQFGGEVPAASAEAPSAPLFSVIQQQLGLRLEATRRPVSALVVDKAERPSAN
jgi:hypothetical protein